ncbi:hypothetical protein C1645_833999 [Glomus cerebriforme]|uniref:Uncharacterized protein n=1 Tax=Glomus cerebriforme TaxID=658196 RepID=A0A397SAF9_9GLOM|nr:hypothetical protein C1645_833999 [Glomus cerebriforme]
MPPTIPPFIRTSVPFSIALSTPPPIPPSIAWLERAKQSATFNKKLYTIIGGVLVFCSFVVGNHWSLKTQLDIIKERQENIRKEFLAKLEGQNAINEVNEVYNGK